MTQKSSSSGKGVMSGSGAKGPGGWPSKVPDMDSGKGRDNAPPRKK